MDICVGVALVSEVFRISYVRIKYLRKSYGLILMRILILISLVTNKLTKPIYYLRMIISYHRKVK